MAAADGDSVAGQDVVCYEIAYDDTHAQPVRAGANLLAVQSNNASYLRDGQTGETEQQLAMARLLRAREHDRAAVIATRPASARSSARPGASRPVPASARRARS